MSGTIVVLGVLWLIAYLVPIFLEHRAKNRELKQWENLKK